MTAAAHSTDVDARRRQQWARVAASAGLAAATALTVVALVTAHGPSQPATPTTSVGATVGGAGFPPSAAPVPSATP